MTTATGAVEKFKERNEQVLDERDLQYLNLVTDLGEIDYTGELDELNLGDYKWQDQAQCAMHYMAVPGVGYGNVAAAFAAPFMSNIRLGAQVTGINDEDPERAVVSFTQGGEAREVAAKAVLVTASLGVLKAGTISFAPPLPNWKQDAIDHMGFGVMNKCILTWRDPDALVWPEQQTWFELLTADGDRSGRWTTFFNPSQFKGVPTLVGWIGGAEARAMEAQTDAEVLDDVMAHLAAMFPTITRPDRVVVTRWGREEHVRGTYCFKPVGRDYVADSGRLRRRVGRVRFAGEATHPVWYGTTYGGWESGEEEARGIAAEVASTSEGSDADVSTAAAPVPSDDQGEAVSVLHSSTAASTDTNTSPAATPTGSSGPSSSPSSSLSSSTSPAAVASASETSTAPSMPSFHLAQSLLVLGTLMFNLLL